MRKFKKVSVKLIASMIAVIISYVKIKATADCTFTIENDLSHLNCSMKLNNTKNVTLNKNDEIVFS